MRRITFTTIAILALFCVPLQAQMVHPCFDFDQNGSSNIIDLVRASEVLVGHIPLPAGQGDIDGRDGFNLGDFRFYDLWLFRGGAIGSCPPHPAYSILPGADSLILGTATIPAGDGQIDIPILLKNSTQVSDILLPLHASSTSGSVSIIDLVRDPNPSPLDLGNFGFVGSDAITQFSAMVDNLAAPGIHLLGYVTVAYTGSAGGVVSLDTTSFGGFQLPHYVYGDFQQADYSLATIGVPAIATGSTSGYPMLTIEPDSLYFETLTGYPNPNPQSFSVVSDGVLYSWTLSHDSWLQVSATSGVSGQSVEVTPNISGMGPGTHVGTIVLESNDALGTPHVLKVYVTLKPQYQSFDANCDGSFNISDIVMQIQYIFGSGQIPCDPCTGEPLK